MSNRFTVTKLGTGGIRSLQGSLRQRLTAPRLTLESHKACRLPYQGCRRHQCQKCSGTDDGLHCQRCSALLPYKVTAWANIPRRAKEAGPLEDITTATAAGGWKYTHQFRSTRDVWQLHLYEVSNRKKKKSPQILAPESDGTKAHIAIPQGPLLSYLFQWLTCFATFLIVGWLVMLCGGGVEITGSVGSGVLELSKHTLCWHLAHLGILDVEVLVTICWNLVHSLVRMHEILRNFPQAGRLQPHPPLYIFLAIRSA